MKRYIKSNVEDIPEKFTPMNMRYVLKKFDIDTTLHVYELKAEKYERYEQGEIYTLKFKANGDYLAYFSMTLHSRPHSQAIAYYFDNDIEEFYEFVKAHPSVSAIEEYASSVWYGDGDDYIIYLKNLDTGKVLYEGYYEENEEKYEDMEDEEGWEDGIF